jgi:MFS family permease
LNAAAARGFGVLKHRDFTLYLVARVCSSLAAQMLIVAVGWQIFNLTGRVLDLGLIGLSQFLPFLCLSLFAGHAADHFDRKLIVALCLATFLVCALLLFFLALGGVRTTLPIFAVLALLGIARAFLTPAGQSLVPNIVPASALGNAVAVNSSTFQLATIAGPSFGGIVYAFGGAPWVYGVTAALLTLSLLLMLWVSATRARGIRS